MQSPGRIDRGVAAVARGRIVVNPGSQFRYLIVESTPAVPEELTSDLQRLGAAVTKMSLQCLLRMPTAPDTSDVVLLSTAQGELSSALELIRDLFPRTRVVVLCSVTSIQTAFEAGRLGADGVCSRHATGDQVEAVVFSSGELLSTTPTADRIEWEYLMDVVAECRGNKSEAARRVGLRRWSLKRKLAKIPVRSPVQLGSQPGG